MARRRGRRHAGADRREVEDARLAASSPPVVEERGQGARAGRLHRVAHDQGDGLGLHLGRARQGQALHEAAGEGVQHLVVEEFLRDGEVTDDARIAAQLRIAPPPWLQRRQAAVGEPLRAKFLLREGQYEVQLAAAVAHQLREQQIAAARGTAIADGAVEGVQLLADGVADGRFQGGVGGEAERGAGTVDGVAGEDDDGTDLEQAQQVVAEGQPAAKHAELAAHRGHVAVGVGRAREAHRAGVVVAGGAVVAEQQARFAEGGRQPVVVGVRIGPVEGRVYGVPDAGGEGAGGFRFAGEQGEGGGVDAGKGIAAEFVGLLVEGEGFAEPGGAGVRAGGARGDVLAGASGQAEGVSAEGGRQVGQPEQVLDEQRGAGGVAAAGQGESAAVEEVGIVGTPLGHAAGGDFEGEAGMAALEKEAGEAAVQLRTFRPDVLERRRAAEGEEAEDWRVLGGEPFEDGGGGRGGKESGGVHAEARELVRRDRRVRRALRCVGPAPYDTSFASRGQGLPC